MDQDLLRKAEDCLHDLRSCLSDFAKRIEGGVARPGPIRSEAYQTSQELASKEQVAELEGLRSALTRRLGEAIGLAYDHVIEPYLGVTDLIGSIQRTMESRGEDEMAVAVPVRHRGRNWAPAASLMPSERTRRLLDEKGHWPPTWNLWISLKLRKLERLRREGVDFLDDVGGLLLRLERVERAIEIASDRKGRLPKAEGVSESLCTGQEGLEA